MKFKIMCSVVLMSLSSASMAVVLESCPEPSAIQHVAGVYTAETLNKGNEWLGVVTSPDPKAIKAFDSATFYSSGEPKIRAGVLEKCAYLSENGETVDLYYRRGGRTNDMSASNLYSWQRQAGTSGFGMEVYKCSKKEKGACTFVVFDK